MIECGCGQALEWQTAEAVAVLIAWNVVKAAAGA